MSGPIQPTQGLGKWDMAGCKKNNEVQAVAFLHHPFRRIILHRKAVNGSNFAGPMTAARPWRSRAMASTLRELEASLSARNDDGARHIGSFMQDSDEASEVSHLQTQRSFDLGERFGGVVRPEHPRDLPRADRRMKA